MVNTFCHADQKEFHLFFNWLLLFTFLKQHCRFSHLNFSLFVSLFESNFHPFCTCWENTEIQAGQLNNLFKGFWYVLLQLTITQGGFHSLYCSPVTWWGMNLCIVQGSNMYLDSNSVKQSRQITMYMDFEKFHFKLKFTSN